MTQGEQDLARVQKAVDELGEFFDTVQIFTSRHAQGEEGGTIQVTLGAGNFFARYGQTRDWIVKTEERARKDIGEGERD